MTQKTSFHIGGFVKVKYPPFSSWGIGKLCGVSNRDANLEFFDLPGIPYTAIEIPLAHVEPTRLPFQVRVYRSTDSGRWQIGRVLEDDGATIFAQFPNGETINVEVSELYVRWSKPLTDPLPLLISEATETPFLANSRSEFMRSVTRQHHVASGVSAVLCSSIDLVDYQFDVVRQVLTDPVQRYLLADEVGLGKTIEASIIVRQYFIDDPKACAVIVVPTALTYQWRKELTFRFGLGIHLDDSLHVIAHDDLERLSNIIDKAGMLVVDEAHHLSLDSSNAHLELYSLLESYAKTLPRLLLLSATPVLGNSAGFLRILHLLDPVVFPLDDLEGFERRITSRQVIAEVVSILTPENVWGMGPDLDRLMSNYADDPLLVEKVEGLKEVLNRLPDEEDEQFLTVLNDLKTHLVESYRLHRRLLRNRRATVPWATPRRAKMEAVSFSGLATGNWRELLSDLRLTAIATCDLSEQVEVALLQSAVNPIGCSSLRLTMESATLINSDLLNLADALDQATLRLREDPKRLDVLCRLVRNKLETQGAQVVVFCDRPETADRVMLALKREIGEQVVRHESVESDEDGDVISPRWETFMASPDRVRVLVCDVRAEEGVNLHGGRKIAIHYDLPLSPNRIEQRLGRLDRYGTGDPIMSYVLIDEENPDEVAWANVLDQGWGVFSQSIASLQYLIEASVGPLAREWVELGTVAFQSLTQRLGGENGLVRNEVRQLNYQDSLDAMGRREIVGMENLEDEDSNWEEWREAFKSLAIEALQFHWRSESESGAPLTEPPFRIGYAYKVGGKPTLLPLMGFLNHFLETVDDTAVGSSSRMPLSHRYAFKRSTTTSRRGLAQGVRLLRIGDSLVTALEHFCANDDRGRAFALWRVDREYQVSDPSGADLYFRFDFLVHPGFLEGISVEQEDQVESSSQIYAQAILRKASIFLPPLAIRVWVRGNGEIENNPMDLLTSEYSNTWKGSRRDFNLNVRRWRGLPETVKSTWMRDWGELCQRLRESALESVRDLRAYQETLDRAVHACIRERQLRRSQGETRASRLVGEAKAQELKELSQAEAMYKALEHAIRNPRIDLDVVGAVFLASEADFKE